MLRFTWWSLRGRWELIITLSLGLLCISICTTLLAGFTQLSTLTATRRVSQSWHTSYDLLVRTPDSISQVEQHMHIVDPAMPEQTYGGITPAQLATITHIAHVQVAAPEATVGWVQLHPYELLPLNSPGLFRVTTDLYEQEQGKLVLVEQVQQTYVTLPLTNYIVAEHTRPLAHVTYIPLDASGKATVAASWTVPALLAGIDPHAEAQLVGLRWSPTVHNGQSGLPLLMNTHPWTPLSANITVEHAALTPSDIARLSDIASIDTWKVVMHTQLNAQQLLAQLAHELASQQLQRALTPLQGGSVIRYTRLGYTSNDNTLDMATMGVDSSGAVTRFPLLPQQATPWLTLDGKAGIAGGGTSFATFDAATLSAANDNALPMGLYRPQPVGAPTSLFTQHSVASWSPMLFTTMDVACHLTGARCISAIRVRVADLGTFGPRSESLLQQVAMDIEARTQLHVDVLTGSSGRPLTTQFSEGNRQGTHSFAEMWTQPYAAITISNGVNAANILLLSAVASVAMLALIAAALLAAHERTSDLRLLLETGWSRRLLLLESMLEAGAAALLAALPAWLCSLLLIRLGAPEVPFASLISAPGIGMLLYVIVVVQTTRLVLRDRVPIIRRKQSVWTRGPWWWMMFRRQLSWRRGNMILVIIALAGTCGLISFMSLVQSTIDGILYATLLGRQVQVSLSNVHTITALLTCASAILTTALTLLLVTRERLPELDILRAVGWTRRSIASEMIREGILLGLLGGLSGGLAAEVFFLALYHTWTLPLLLTYFVGAGMLGAVLCGLGAIYPVLFSLQRLSNRTTQHL